MTKIKNALILISLFTLGSGTYAQNKVSSDRLSEDWIKVSEESGIIFSVKKEKCTIEGVDKQFTYGFVRIENVTSEPNSVIETDCAFDNAQLSFLIDNPLQKDHKNLLEVIITSK